MAAVLARTGGLLIGWVYSAAAGTQQPRMGRIVGRARFCRIDAAGGGHGAHAFAPLPLSVGPTLCPFDRQPALHQSGAPDRKADTCRKAPMGRATWHRQGALGATWLWP